MENNLMAVARKVIDSAADFCDEKTVVGIAKEIFSVPFWGVRERKVE